MLRPQAITPLSVLIHEPWLRLAAPNGVKCAKPCDYDGIQNNHYKLPTYNANGRVSQLAERFTLHLGVCRQQTIHLQHEGVLIGQRCGFLDCRAKDGCLEVSSVLHLRT